MMTPINKNESSKNLLPQSKPLQGHVQKLLGGGNAPQMGPLLHHLFRKILEGRQIQNSTIEDLIGKQPLVMGDLRKNWSPPLLLLWTKLLRQSFNCFNTQMNRPEMHTVPFSFCLDLKASD